MPRDAARDLLAYQSRTGPVKWIGTGTAQMLDALGREGVRNVLVVVANGPCS